MYEWIFQAARGGLHDVAKTLLGRFTFYTDRQIFFMKNWRVAEWYKYKNRPRWYLYSYTIHTYIISHTGLLDEYWNKIIKFLKLHTLITSCSWLSTLVSGSTYIHNLHTCMTKHASYQLCFIVTMNQVYTESLQQTT